MEILVRLLKTNDLAQQRYEMVCQMRNINDFKMKVTQKVNVKTKENNILLN